MLEEFIDFGGSVAFIIKLCHRSMEVEMESGLHWHAQFLKEVVAGCHG